MDQRKKEDKLMQDLKNPDKEHSSEISRIIDTTLRAGHKVWLGCDWHLFLREVKDQPACHMRSDAKQIINTFNKGIQPDDFFIYMGDLVDGEFQEKDKLKELLLPLNGKNMILVRGNNDLFDERFYKSCGFKYVVESFVWKNMLFTHVPCVNHNDLNIHAHLHSYHRYRIPYTNQIDVAYLGGRKEPVDLTDLMKKQPSYSKIIIEEPEHFNESEIAMDVFTKSFISDRVYDPYHDDDE